MLDASQIEDLITPPENTSAQLIVVFNINEGTGFDTLDCTAASITRFINEKTLASSELITIVNTAARVITNEDNITALYTSIINNMLHVPSFLRKNPN